MTSPGRIAARAADRSATSSSVRFAATTRSRAASSSSRRRSGSGSSRSGRPCRPSASSPSGWASRARRCARRSPALRRPAWCARRAVAAAEPSCPTARQAPAKGGSPGIAERREELLDSLVFRRVVEPGRLLRAASRDAAGPRADAADHGAGRGRRGRRTRRRTGRPTRGCTWPSPASTGSPMTVEAVTEVQVCLHDMLQAIPVLEVNIEHSDAPAPRDRHGRSSRASRPRRGARWSSTATTRPRCCAACWAETDAH